MDGVVFDVPGAKRADEPGGGPGGGPSFVRSMEACRAAESANLMGHKHLGGKTILYLIDALYAAPHQNQGLEKWQSPPFDGHWTAACLPRRTRWPLNP